jgi:divalent metal cation (Fe/Co/Zn/Cd) transporter
MGGIILFAGESALFHAIWSIRIGQEAEYEPFMLLILVGAAVIKLAMGVLFKRRGRALNSDPLVASGVDSMLDAAITAATIVAAIIFMASGVSTEAYLAIAIALITLKAGFDVLLNAISKTLGLRVSPEVSGAVREAIEKVPGVIKACDMRLVDHGPENIRGCVYIEVDERLSVVEADRIARSAQLAAFMDCGAHLDAVGVTPVSCADEETLRMRQRLEELAMAHEHVLDMHGFRVKKGGNVATFSVTADFAVEDRELLADEIAAEAERESPDCQFFVTTVSDFTD